MTFCILFLSHSCTSRFLGSASSWKCCHILRLLCNFQCLRSVVFSIRCLILCSIYLPFNFSLQFLFSMIKKCVLSMMDWTFIFQSIILKLFFSYIFFMFFIVFCCVFIVIGFQGVVKHCNKWLELNWIIISYCDSVCPDEPVLLRTFLMMI